MKTTEQESEIMGVALDSTMPILIEVANTIHQKIHNDKKLKYILNQCITDFDFKKVYLTLMSILSFEMFECIGNMIAEDATCITDGYIRHMKKTNLEIKKLRKISNLPTTQSLH